MSQRLWRNVRFFFFLTLLMKDLFHNFLSLATFWFFGFFFFHYRTRQQTETREAHHIC